MSTIEQNTIVAAVISALGLVSSGLYFYFRKGFHVGKKSKKTDAGHPEQLHRASLTSENQEDQAKLRDAKELIDAIAEVNIAIETGHGDALAIVIARSLQNISEKNAAIQISRFSKNDATEVLAQFTSEEKKTAIALQIQKNETEGVDVVKEESKSIAAVLEEIGNYKAAKMITKLSIDQAALAVLAFSSSDKRRLLLQSLDDLTLNFEIEDPGFYPSLMDKIKAVEKKSKKT